MGKFCRICGRKLREDELFCFKCGTKVVSSNKKEFINNTSDETIEIKNKNMDQNIHEDQKKESLSIHDLIFEVNGNSINLTLLINKFGNDRAGATNEFIKMSGIKINDSIKVIDNAYEGRIFYPVESSSFENNKKNYKKYIPYVLLFPLLPYYFVVKSKKIKTMMKIPILLSYTAVLLFIFSVQTSVPVKTLLISTSKIEIDRDTSQDIFVTFNPTNATNSSNIICTSKNEKIVTILDYTMKGIAEGEATLTCSVGEVISNEIKIIVKLSDEQKVEVARKALLAKYGLKGYTLLLDKGITEDMLVSLDSVLTKVDIGKIDSANTATVTNGITTYAISTEKGSFKIGFKDLKLFSIIDSQDVSIFSNNTINENYIFAADINLTSFRDKSIELIREKLKSPSTAKFPGSFWDGYEGWSYVTKNNVVSILSYVDAQNSFGAIIRNNFVIQYTYIKSSDTWTSTYIELGGDSSGNFVY